MANSFGTDILLQPPDPRRAATPYVDLLHVTRNEDTPDLVSLLGDHINHFMERRPALGPVLEITVPDVADVRQRLPAAGCQVLKDGPEVRRCSVQDPAGLNLQPAQIYNLRLQPAQRAAWQNTPARLRLALWPVRA